MKRKSKTIDAWWFAASDTLPHGDGRRVVIGETLKVEPPIIPCKHGLHASVDPFDALQYAPGPMLYKVRLSGEIKRDGDKHAASERTALDCRDATEMLRLFARKTALSVIHLWDAPAVVQEYLKTGDETKRAAAWAAAGDATWDAARAATWDAAWAAAGDAEDAAWAAARAAAKDAAWAAAWAAEDAAGAATWDAARKLFGELVDQMFSTEV